MLNIQITLNTVCRLNAFDKTSVLFVLNIMLFSETLTLIGNLFFIIIYCHNRQNTIL